MQMVSSACPDKDIVVGVIAGYDFDTIRCWVNSLDRTSFAGLKLMLCADVNEACVRELEYRNYSVVKFARLDSSGIVDSIFKERFFHLWRTLTTLDASRMYRFVVFAD